MGGGTDAVRRAARQRHSAATTRFGVLRDLLDSLEDRLQSCRRRRAPSGARPGDALDLAGARLAPSAYGSRAIPFTGDRGFHPGLDISADHGEPVSRPPTGIVDAAQRSSGNYGNLVVLDHGFGISTRYGHLSRFAVMNGEQVRRGDVDRLRRRHRPRRPAPTCTTKSWSTAS